MLSSPLIILLSILIYGFVHTLLATLEVKARVKQLFGRAADRWYRLVYNVFAVVTLLPILVLPFILLDMPMYTIPVPWLYLSTAVQLLALLALGIGLLQTGLWTFLGFQQIVNPVQDGSSQMVTDGLYRWVRHPLYTAGLVLIWLIPVMTYNLLALNLGLTIYLILGAVYEERKLVREFGDDYVSYQVRVPMLIPLIFRRQRPGESED